MAVLNADGAQVEFGYIVEATYGATPEAPELKQLRFNTDSLDIVKPGLTSGEIRADRRITGLRHGNRQVGGMINAELAFTDFDDMIEAVMMGTWATDQVRMGTTFRSFQIEKGYKDVAEFELFSGMVVNTMSISVRLNQIVTVSFGFIGSDMVPAQLTVDTSGALTAPTSGLAPFDAFTGSVTGDTSAMITGLDFTVSNNGQPAFTLFDPAAIEVDLGRSKITGTITGHFQNDTIKDKYLAETESELVLTLTDPADNDLEFDFPAIKYTGAATPVTGEGPIIMSVPFEAYYKGDGDLSNLIIDSTP